MPIWIGLIFERSSAGINNLRQFAKTLQIPIISNALLLYNKINFPTQVDFLHEYWPDKLRKCFTPRRLARVKRQFKLYMTQHFVQNG